VEGLLERFLARALEARETERRKQAALQVLLALIDMQKNVRAGFFTVSDLQGKVATTLSGAETQEAIEWLARADVRLVTPSTRNGVVTYELAHERLISAVQRLAGKQLLHADQANRLLDRRVNEWLGNNRSSRYLLTWHELRLITRQKPYLSWTLQKNQKEMLLSESKRRLRWYIGGATLAVMLVSCSFLLYKSSWGQIWLIKRSLINLSETDDDNTLYTIALILPSLKYYEQARTTAEKIRDPKLQASALAYVILNVPEIGNASKTSALFDKAW